VCEKGDYNTAIECWWS